MISWIIQVTCISIIFILIVHHLVQLLKDTLTYPITKDLVNIPTKKYEDIYNVLKQGQRQLGGNDDYSDTTPIHSLDISRDNLLPSFDVDKEPSPENNMKSELKNFIKKQQQNPHQHTPQNYTSLSNS
jgi:hypothetical protein